MNSFVRRYGNVVLVILALVAVISAVASVGGLLRASPGKNNSDVSLGNGANAQPAYAALEAEDTYVISPNFEINGFSYFYRLLKLDGDNVTVTELYSKHQIPLVFTHNNYYVLPGATVYQIDEKGEYEPNLALTAYKTYNKYGLVEVTTDKAYELTDKYDKYGEYYLYELASLDGSVSDLTYYAVVCGELNFARFSYSVESGVKVYEKDFSHSSILAGTVLESTALERVFHFVFVPLNPG